VDGGIITMAPEEGDPVSTEYCVEGDVLRFFGEADGTELLVALTRDDS
jgi:hypothetical protein